MSAVLGERVRELRIKAGLTLRAFARKVGVSPPFMSDFEKGRRSTNKLPEMAAALGVDLDELRALDGRVEPDLARWIAENPGLVALLREMKSCRRCGGRRRRLSCGHCGRPADPATTGKERP